MRSEVEGQVIVVPFVRLTRRYEVEVDGVTLCVEPHPDYESFTRIIRREGSESVMPSSIVFRKETELAAIYMMLKAYFAQED